MNQPDILVRHATQIKRYAGVLIVVWTCVVIISAIWNLYSSNQAAQDAALSEARASFNKDLVYRRWAALNGGVYVPVSDMAQPNPYLDVPEREITTPSGRVLTLVNPAYMTRQVHELAQEQYGTRGHITSLNPIRPENAPDAWETKALQSFEQGIIETSSVEIEDGQSVLRYMHVMITEESCLKCHAAQGYQVGDIRGGISVAVLMQAHWDVERPLRQGIIWGHGTFWMLGLAGIALVTHRFLAFSRRQEDAIQAVRESAEQYQVIAATTMDGFWRVDQTGRLLDVNDTYCCMSGYTRDELLAMSISDLDCQETPDTNAVHIHNIIETGADRFESRHRCKDGHILDVEISTTFMRTAGYFLTFVRDISEHKQAVEALRESERLLRKIAENYPNSYISIIQQDLTVGFTSGQEFKKRGIDPQQFVGLTLEQIFGDQANIVRQQYEKTFEGEECSFELLINDQYQLYRTVPLTTEDGSIHRILSVVENIAERKRIENAEHQQRVFAEALRDMAAALNSSLDFEKILDHILANVGRVVPHDAANIMLIDGDTAYVARCKGYEKYGTQEWTQAVRVLIEHRPKLRQVFATGQGYLVLNTKTDTKWINTPETGWIGSHIAQAICADNRVIGLINLDSAVPNTFTPDAANRLQVFADQASIAIQNAYMYRRLASYSEDLEQAVIERTLELTKANEDLKRLSRAKDEFVSNVSHELKSPITTLTLHHYLLRKKPQEIETHLNILERETARLNRTIEDLLRLSRLDQDRIKVTLGLVDLNPIAENLTRDRTIQAQQKGLTLEFSGHEDLPMVIADSGLLEQVMSILLTNAINYTPSSGHIMIQTQTEQQETRLWAGFSITDTGLGISQDDQMHLFERFFQGKANRQSGASGMGLGLAIAKEIIDRHHGRIEVKSTGIPGEGTTFTVWLPTGERADGSFTIG